MRLGTMLLASALSIVSFPATSADESTRDPAPGSGAAAGESTASDSDVAAVDIVIVTGTRVVGRTVSESAVPIDVISAGALTNNGLTETSKILSSLVPSFNFPQPSITDGTAVIRPATLRGLSPDQTLVLVNGKRRHVSSLLNINNSVGRGSSAVDLNLIPALAVARIEVLRDGASSQYGSDAIAGVINFQLKKAREGGRVAVSYGKYVTTLDGVANVTGLQTNPAGQPMLDPADARIFLANSDGEREARDGALTTFAANIGIPLGEGYVNLTAEYRDRQPTNRAAHDLRPNYNRASSSAPFDPLELSFDRLNFKSGDAQTEDYNFFFNGGAPVTEELELYAFGSYGKREGLSAANYRQSRSADNRDYSVLAPSTTPNAANFVPLRRDGFLPSLDTDLKDLAGTVGLRGEVAEWNSDLPAARLPIRSNATNTPGSNGAITLVRSAVSASFDRPYGVLSRSRFCSESHLRSVKK